MDLKDRGEEVVVSNSSSNVRSTHNSNHNHNRTRRSRDLIFVVKSCLSKARMVVEVEIRWVIEGEVAVEEVDMEQECAVVDDSD